MDTDTPGNDRIAGLRNPSAAPQRLGDFDATVTASPEDLTAVIRGRLTAASVAISAGRILEPIKRLKPHEVIIQGSDLTYCDGAGIGLIGEVRRVASASGGVVRFRGLSTDLQTLIDMSALPDPSAPQL